MVPLQSSITCHCGKAALLPHKIDLASTIFRHLIYSIHRQGWTVEMSGLTFRPWARDPSAEPSISDALQRARFERGPFRDITEASLLEELAGEGAMELSDSEDEDEDEVKDEGRTTEKPGTRDELFAVKNEMLQHVKQAEQDIVRALDYVSLALSKDNPGAAVGTLSPWVKDKVPLGTFGVDLWQRMPVDHAKRAQEELLATNVRMQGLQQSADGLLAAATRLEQNVRKETRYWESILSVSNKGWNVCRASKQQHRLAVTFGFNESSSQFSRKGIAALDADLDGNVRLERGVGSRPEALHVVLRRDGKTIGSSRLPSSPDHEDMTLEARIRNARDSLFDEELFHEMMLESRMLTSLGIAMEGAALCCADSGDENALEVTFEVMRLDQEGNLPSEEETKNDRLAQAIAHVAGLLLTQAHRERLHKRSEVPAILMEQQNSQPRLQILRPILSFVRHQSAIDQLNTYLHQIEALLAAAKIRTSVRGAHLALPTTDVNSAEDLCKLLLQPWRSDSAITIYDDKENGFTVNIDIMTSLSTSFGAVYILTAPDGHRIDCRNLDELRLSVDPCVASGLATQLGDAAPGTWKAIAREAMLEKEGNGGMIERMWVELDSAEPTLVLRVGDRKMAWSSGIGEELEKRSFWLACSEDVKVESEV